MQEIQNSITCYMCEKEATSYDHVPPKCLFPEKKDTIDGKDFRKDLIKVSSCNDHNQVVSKDDEYMMAALSFYFKNNKVGERQVISKVKRSMTRSRGFFETFFGPRDPGIAYIDKNRLERGLSKVAKGIYFHHTGEKWLNQAIIYTPVLDIIGSKSPGVRTALVENRQAYRHIVQYLGYEKKWGGNPEVFYYKIWADTTVNLRIVNMVFYEGFDVIAFSRFFGETLKLP